MSKKSKLLDRHAKILKIAQDENHPELLEQANSLYDLIASMDDEDEEEEEGGDNGNGGNHPPGGPGKP